MRERFGDLKVQKNDGTEAPTVEKATSIRDKLVRPEGVKTWLIGPLFVTVYASSNAIQHRQIPHIPGVLASTYPDLYEQLTAGPSSQPEREFTIAVLAVDPLGVESRRAVELGETTTKVAIDMKRETEEALRVLAQEAQKDTSPLHEVDYFVGFSRLAHGARLLGFDVFADSSRLENKHKHSLKLAIKNYVQAGHSKTEAEKTISKHSPGLAVLSRARLLELYSKEQDIIT